MSRVLFMCGPAGSGKSTLARRLEADGMVRLSVDVEAFARGHRTMPLPDEVQREHAFRSGVNIMMYMLTGNYKADQVHVPALLERLGQ